MKFEIDVSGYDIFGDKKYVICIAGNGKELIKWFKFNEVLVEKIVSNWKNKKYKYDLSKKQKGFLKVRIYCIIIYYLFKSIKEELKEIELIICEDFSGHKTDINENLRYFLEQLLKLKIKSIIHKRLPNKSNAHCYAFSVYRDKYGLFDNHINMNLVDIERYL